MMHSKRILIIGAGGQMTGRTAKALIKRLNGTAHFTLTDISEEALARVSRGLGGDNISTQRLDIYDQAALLAAVGDADFVIHGAGPFHKTAQPVRAACLRAGADYMDIDDDVESSLEAIDMDQDAQRAGRALYVGCGASPGLTNMLARMLIDQLDTVEDVEVAWCSGGGGNMTVGRSVAEHTMHIYAGDCVTWRDGKQVTHPSFVATTVFPMGALLGEYRLYECAHPETVMLPHSFPQLRSATCWGGLYPQPLNGLLKGVAQAQRRGAISMDEACTFLIDVIEGRSGALNVWRHALAGVWGQVRGKESDLRTLMRFIAQQARGTHDTVRMGLAARATGRQGNRRVTLHCATVDHGVGSSIDSMEAATGLSQAAFALLALQGTQRRGCLFPEAWADPQAFLNTLSGLAERTEAVIVSPVHAEILAA